MNRFIAIALAAWILVPFQPSSGPVAVYGWVEDGSGRPATDLRLEDFEVLVDRVPIPLESLAPRDGPASCVLLLDATKSTSWLPRPLDEQIATFAAALAPDDRLMLATIGERVTFSSFRPATHDLRDEVRNAVESGAAHGFGNSPLWDATHEAVTQLAAQPPPRTILLLSDGRATGNEHGLIEVADYAMARGVAINIVLKQTAQRIRQSPETAVLIQPGAPLEGLTAYTGGLLFFYPEFQDDQARARFTHLAASMRALHAFAFTPPNRDGRAHRLEIRSKRPELTVHAPLAFVAR